MICVYYFIADKAKVYIVCITMESFRRKIAQYLAEEQQLNEKDITFIVDRLTNGLLPNLEHPFSSDWTADRHFLNFNGTSFRTEVLASEKDSLCFHCPELKDGCLCDYNSPNICDSCRIGIAYERKRRRRYEPKSLKDDILSLFRRKK